MFSIGSLRSGFHTTCPTLLRNPFRPFYLVGALYGPLFMLYWLFTTSGLWVGQTLAYPAHLFHGHEMIFGFAAAIIAGFVLTALPSWAGTKEVHGWPLALLVCLWLAGRLSMLYASRLSPQWVMAVDSSLFLAMGAMVAPGLWCARNKAYLVLLIIFASLFCGNLLFHTGIMSGDIMRATLGLHIGIYAIMVKFTLVSGYLTPIFTNNILQERGIEEITFHPLIETLAVVSIVAFVVTGLLGQNATWSGTAALLAAVVHSMRLYRWKSREIKKAPVVLVMHLAYAWMILCFALRAIADFSGSIPINTWLHAFTVGAMGLMMLGLMTRVVLRHTGRPLKPANILVAAYGLMLLAGIARVALCLFGFIPWLQLLSALLWVAPFVVYLKLHGAMLLQPSLPRKTLP